LNIMLVFEMYTFQFGVLLNEKTPNKMSFPSILGNFCVYRNPDLILIHMGSIFAQAYTSRKWWK